MIQQKARTQVPVQQCTVSRMHATYGTHTQEKVFMSAVSCRPVNRRSLPSPYEAMCSLCLNPSFSIAFLITSKPPSSRMDNVLLDNHTTICVKMFALHTGTSWQRQEHNIQPYPPHWQRTQRYLSNLSACVSEDMLSDSSNTRILPVVCVATSTIPITLFCITRNMNNIRSNIQESNCLDADTKMKVSNARLLQSKRDSYFNRLRVQWKHHSCNFRNPLQEKPPTTFDTYTL